MLYCMNAKRYPPQRGNLQYKQYVAIPNSIDSSIYSHHYVFVLSLASSLFDYSVALQMESLISASLDEERAQKVLANFHLEHMIGTGRRNQTRQFKEVHRGSCDYLNCVCLYSYTGVSKIQRTQHLQS